MPRWRLPGFDSGGAEMDQSNGNCSYKVEKVSHKKSSKTDIIVATIIVVSAILSFSVLVFQFAKTV